MIDSISLPEYNQAFLSFVTHPLQPLSTLASSSPPAVAPLVIFRMSMLLPSDYLEFPVL